MQKKPRMIHLRLSKVHIRILLYILAGALLLAAGAIFLIQWNEGEQAQKNAQALLAVASDIPQSLPEQGYVQPEAPDAQTEQEITNLLETELKGYKVIARLDIAKIGLSLPILSQTSSAALKVSICYYRGPEPGGDGNLIITGHNYKSGAHFGNLDKLAKGDTVLITGKDGKTTTYTVYKLAHIKPDNPEALEDTQYPKELTLLTCEANGNGRLLVRCRAG